MLSPCVVSMRDNRLAPGEPAVFGTGDVNVVSVSVRTTLYEPVRGEGAIAKRNDGWEVSPINEPVFTFRDRARLGLGTGVASCEAQRVSLISHLLDPASVTRPSAVALSSGSRLSIPAGDLSASIVSAAWLSDEVLFAFLEELERGLQPKARIMEMKSENPRAAMNSFTGRRLPSLRITFPRDRYGTLREGYRDTNKNNVMMVNLIA